MIKINEQYLKFCMQAILARKDQTENALLPNWNILQFTLKCLNEIDILDFIN